MEPSTRLSPNGRRAVLAGGIGTALEYYDFALYGAAAALVFGPLFFPNVSPTIGLLAAFGTFAVGFVGRPVGALVISHFGDRYGRKPALLATMVIMGVATIGVGLLPTYASIGLAAPILLVALRLLQGMGAGAEFSGVTTMIIESTPTRRRTFYSSFGSAAYSVGLTIAALVFLSISALPRDVLLGWAWRIPFLASAVIFALAIWIRRRLEETPEFVAAAEARNTVPTQRLPIITLLAERRREVLIGFFAITGSGVFSYVMNTYMLSYLTQNVGLSRPLALGTTICMSAVGAVIVPFLGRLGDLFGPGRMLLAGALFSAVAVVPLFLLLDTADPVVVIVSLTVVYVLGWGTLSGCHGPFLADLFEPKFRLTGMSLTREMNLAVFGGTAPFVAAALVGAAGGRPWYLALYLVIVCGIVTPTAILIALRHPRQDDASPAAEAPLGTGGASLSPVEPTVRS